MTDNKASRILELVDKIYYHKKKYYQGTPEISDVEFDRLESELRSLDPNHPVLSYVGSETSFESSKVEHKIPMLSLEKTYDREELLDWIENRSVVGTIKIDGNSLGLKYEGGSFIFAATRGNGQVGEDVTDKVAWIGSIPKTINLEDKNSGDTTIEVRGELCCQKAMFQQLCDEMLSLGMPRPVSSRNIVAGLLGRKNYLELMRFTSFYAFDVLGLDFNSEIDKFLWLKKQGFLIPDPCLLKTKEEVESFVDAVIQNDFSYLKQGVNESSLDIDPTDDTKSVEYDGVVFCYSDLSLRQLGSTQHHPRYKLAFKWQGESAQSQIVGINWDVSRFGVITPVIVIEPVWLSGASITNVTMHNASYIKEHNIKIGDRVEIIRSGEVIPKFLRVVSSQTGTYSFPDKCPSCSKELEYDGVRLKCNNKSCPSRHGKGILNWIQVIGIEDLSEKRLSFLIQSGLVNNIVDLYKLEKKDFLTLPLTKEKMASKLYQNIQASKNLSLAKFLTGLGIEGMGEGSWEKVIKIYPSLDKIRCCSKEEFEMVDGVAFTTATNMYEGLKQNSSTIDELLSLGLNPKVDLKTQEGKASGKTFVITGTLSKPRSKVEEDIKQKGGNLSSSVSSNTFALVTNDSDSTSSKMKKAKELGISIWNEKELYSFLEN